MKTTKSFQYRSSFAAAVALAACILTARPANAATEKFTASGTFTPPAGITTVTVECWGGGGAGGGAQKTTANSGGGGGGGGAYAKKLIVPVTPGTPYTVTIPAAATCPGSGWANGQTYDGAAVTFTGDSAVSVTANGGTGGASAIDGTGLGGAGGAAGVGYDAAFKGGDGKNNTSSNGGPAGGGASDLGAGNNATANSSTAGAAKAGSDADHNGGAGSGGKTGAGPSGNSNGTAPGGGGGGGKITTVANSFGGAGKIGQIIITYSGSTVVKANNINDLNLGTSWVGDSAPVETGIAKWDSTVTSANTTVLGADVTWGSILIADPTGLVTIGGGNTLTNKGGIDLSSATADLTLNCDLALGGSAVWNVATGRTLTLGGIVSGSFNITEQGDGKVILSAANTYSGVTAISGGTLQLGASDVIPDGSGKGDVSVAATSILDLNSFSDTINGLSGAGTVDNTAASTASTLTVGGNDVTSGFSGIIRNTGSSSTLNLIKTGSGQLTLSGANTFSGTVTVNAGQLNLGNANTLGNISGLTIGGAQLGYQSSSTTLAAPITLTGSMTVIQNSLTALLLNLNSAIGGTGNVTFNTGSATMSGDNRVSLGAASSFVGNVTITTSTQIANNMTVRLGVVNALPVTAVVTLDGGTGNSISWADLNLFGFDQTLAGLKNVTRTSRLQRVYNSGATAATLTIDNTADYTFGGNLGKTGGDDFGLTKNGGGIFTLSGVNTYAGATIVSGGKLAMGADNIMPGSTAVSIGNATLDAATFANTVGTLDVTSTAKINLGTGAALAFADSSAVDWTGGSLDLTGTFVSGASLRFGDGTGTGLTPIQLALISATGFSSFGLDASGYVTATSTGGFSSWITGTFANGTVPALQQGANADPDNDGISNLVEYAVAGQDPTVANAAVGTFAANVLSYTKRAGTNGLTYAIEESTDLGLADVWAAVTPTVDDATTISYTLPVVPAKDFIRLKVLSN